MIRLSSKWKLKNGVTPEFMHNLESAAERVQAKKAGTLTYLIHLEASRSLDESNSDSMPSLTANNKQTAITFIETYDDADAFSDHLEGEIFTNFRKENLKYFEEDPKKPGWPVTEAQIVKLDAGLMQIGLDQGRPSYA